MAVQLLLKLCHHPLSLEQLQQQCPSEYEHALNVVAPNMLNGLPLGIVHAAALLNEQLANKPDSLKELSSNLEKNKGQLSLEPRSIEEWLRNYRLSGIQSKLEVKLSISNLDDVRSLMESTITESSLTPNEKRALLDARDDLVNRPLIGPWRMDIKAVVDTWLVSTSCKQQDYFHEETFLSCS
jgi:hypothetical protein